MTLHYIKKGSEILSKHGLTELIKSCWRFFIYGYRKTVIGDCEVILRSVLNKWKSKFLWKAPADPYDTILIDSSNVQFTKGSAGKINKYHGLGQVRGGDWDKNPEKLNENPTYLGLKQRFEENMPWEETIYVQTQIEKYKNDGECSWGHNTPTDFVENRCAFVDELYKSMEQDGYISSINKNDSLIRSYIKFKPLDKLEPLVCISRTGEFIIIEGHHRITISKMLGLNDIPVNILCRHKHWQKIRDRTCDYLYIEQNADLKGHPDLEYLLNKRV